MAGVDRFFVDTNVLLYSVDPADRRKQAAAHSWLNVLWEHGAGCLSWQVLHEFYVNSIRKLRQPQPDAQTLVEVFALWQPIDTSVGLIQRAWHWADAAQLSYWDSLIGAAAERGGCRWLLTEDLQRGRRLGDITVVDPFQSTPGEFGIDPARPS